MTTFPYRGMASSHRPPLGDSDCGGDNSTCIGLLCAGLSSEHFARVLAHIILPTTLTGRHYYLFLFFSKVRPREIR